MPPRRKEVDESPVHLTAQQAKNLSYQTQEVPSFLKALHSQVNGSRNYKDQNKRSGDELDDLVGVGSSGSSRKRGEREQDFGREDIEDDDEFEGAQIVVLKDGKHLSREELEKERKINPLGQTPTSTDTSSSISGPGLPSNSKKRAAISVPETEDEKAAQAIFDQMTSKATSSNSVDGKKSSSKSGMDEAKDLIAIAKRQKLEKEKEKEKKKEEKNKKARIEKKKSGKGLSFDLED